MKILITGPPRIGKTTLVQRLTKRLEQSPGLATGGFYTEEIRERGVRKGFGITTLGGRKGLLAHVDIESPVRVGKYKVNVEGFEKIALSELERSLSENRLIVIDEIGKMELASSKFRETVEAVFNSPALVVATIGRGTGNLLEELKRKGARSLIVTRENRDELVDQLLVLLKQAQEQV